LSYGVRETPKGFEISVEAADRDGVFRDALTAAVGLAYPSAAPGGFEGSVPLQAAGETQEELLHALVGEFLRTARETRGTLGAPRWLLFEPGRVTATLPHAPGSASPLAFTLRGTRLDGGKASLVLTSGFNGH
jgi:hypothetical protein